MLGHPVDVVSGGTGPPPAADPVLTGYAAVLAEVLAVEAVDPGAHAFDDLGADSMVMARFCARVRKHPDLPAASIKDVYQHPTISSLAAAFAATRPAGTEQPAPTNSTSSSGKERAIAGAVVRWCAIQARGLLYWLSHTYRSSEAHIART